MESLLIISQGCLSEHCTSSFLLTSKVFVVRVKWNRCCQLERGLLVRTLHVFLPAYIKGFCCESQVESVLSIGKRVACHNTASSFLYISNMCMYNFRYLCTYKVICIKKIGLRRSTSSYLHQILFVHVYIPACISLLMKDM